MNTNVNTTDLLTIEPQEFVSQSYKPFTVALDEAIAKVPSLTYEITTPAGMKVAKEGRAMFRDIRIALEKKRAAAKAPIIEIGRLLDSRAKEIAIKIEPYEERFDGDIKAEEARIEAVKAAKAAEEALRQAAIQEKIDVIRNAPAHHTGASSDQINASLDALAQMEITEEIFGDRKDEAVYLMAQSIQQMESMLAGKKAQEQLAAQMEAQRIENERKAAELAAQQAAEEERQRAALKAEADRQRAQAEELAKQRAELESLMAAQRAEAAKLEAQRIAMQEAADLKAKAEADALIAAERAKREAEIQEQAEAERQRVAADVKAQMEAQATQLSFERAETARIASEIVAEARMVNAERDAEAVAIEERRKAVQLTESAALQGKTISNVVQLHASRPSDKEIISNLAANFGISTGTACDWILSVAENLKEAA